MKILLIQPPQTVKTLNERRCQPPLGLAYLAAFLRREHKLAILDCVMEGYHRLSRDRAGFITYGLAEAEIEKRLKDFAPELIGVSSLFTSQSANAHKICKLAKQLNRKIITVLGGAHPSALPAQELNDQNADFVVIGEGEYTFRDLLRELQGQRDFSRLDGVAYKQNGITKVAAKTNYIDALDELPFPAWDLLPLAEYAKINRPHGTQTRRQPFLPVLTSRGCPNHCTFCSVHNLWGRNFRHRSVENILAEIDHLSDNFGIKEIHFEDDNLTLSKERALGLFQGIRNTRAGLSWSTPNGIFIDSVDEKLLNLMKASGCYSISFGVESGDESVLRDIIKKKLDLARAARMINYSRKIGLETAVFFVVGLPGETPEQLNNTFKFARSLKADSINYFFATALPGTELWESVKENQRFCPNDNYLHLTPVRPTLASGAISENRLRAMVAQQKMLSQINLLFSRPDRFLRKAYTKLKQNLN